MRKFLTFCFKTERAAMRTALVVPVTVIALGLFLEVGCGVSHVTSYAICAGIGVALAVGVCAASTYYHRHCR